MKQRTILICGGSGRVGSAIANAAAARGWSVALHYNAGSKRATHITNEITHSGGSASIFQADLTQEMSVEKMIHRVQKSSGAIDVMVNTVHGQFSPKDIADMQWGDWDVHLNALKGHFLICKAVLPIMRKQRRGSIVFISAGLSQRYFRGCSAYTAIKAGLNGFCKTLALEEGRNGISVNIVAPGKVIPSDTRASTDNPEDWDALNNQALKSAPLGRHATAVDVAHAVLYFASPEAEGITGQTLYVASGEIMH